jgi:hypothetical protein
MKRKILICFLDVLFFIQCQRNGRCIIRKVQGFIKIMEMDTAFTESSGALIVYHSLYRRIIRVPFKARK